MSDPLNPSHPDHLKLLRRQHRQRRKARQVLGGCLLMIVFVALIWVGVQVFYGGLYFALKPSDPAGVTLYEPQGVLVYVVISFFLLAGLSSAAIANLRKSPIASTAALIGLAVIGPLVLYFYFYSSFWAVTPSRGKVEMMYLWPRPNRTLDAREITAVEIESESRHVKNSASYWVSRLRITAKGQTWTSEWSRQGTLVTETRAAILREKGTTGASGDR